MKFGANCATSLPARRGEVALPVMVSAHEACVRLWLADARRVLGPHKLPYPVDALAFLDKVGEPLGRHAWIWTTHAAGGYCNEDIYGRVDFVDPAMTESVNVGGWSGLADAASSPRQTAASVSVSVSATASATASATSTAPASAAASATATTAATNARFLNAALGRRYVLLVEDIKRRQTDVGDFFLTEHDLVTR